MYTILIHLLSGYLAGRLTAAILFNHPVQWDEVVVAVILAIVINL